MVNNQATAIDKKLHPNAEDKIREYTDDFATSLVLQSKMLAFREKADVVLSTHVDEALDVIAFRRQEAWAQGISKIVGGALFGAFIPGFLSALPTGDIRAIVIYTALGFVGMFLVFLGIRWQGRYVA
ncbi:unnamed protein product [marine sediment metagenome]|uniref:Uncharacterized protein n=1 Tax=marine sediment metagenome TaxID=412755 RepID=X1SDH2_9ZZZZ